MSALRAIAPPPLSLLRCVLLLMMQAPKFLSAEKHDLQQVLVFDAGSSGTRVHVFNVHPAPLAHVPVVDQSVRQKQTLKVKPGLSQFAETDNLEGARRSIAELLAFADRFVPPAKRSSTPVVLKATAGLRAVSADAAKRMLEHVRKVLMASPYLTQRSWIDIIKGNEEGGLAWIAANYLAGTFRNNAGDRDSLGIVEMGGGSTQVSFHVVDGDRSATLAEDDTYVFTTALRRRYLIYAHSYNNYGQDAAQRKIRERLAPLLRDPCYPTWVNYTRGGSAEIVRGTGRGAECRALIERSLLSELAKDAPGRYLGEPSLEGRFIATENFYYTRNDLGLPLLGDTGAMEAVTDQVCSSASPPPPPIGAEDPKHCFALAYQAALIKALRRNSGEGDDATPMIVDILRQINGGEIDWALGAAVEHVIALSMPESSGSDDDSSSSPGDYPIGGLTTVFCLVVVGVMARLAYHRLKRPAASKAQ